MHFDSIIYGDESENLISIDWVAALCERVIHPLQMLINDETVILP
jgi:hypothetical protein